MDDKFTNEVEKEEIKAPDPVISKAEDKTEAKKVSKYRYVCPRCTNTAFFTDSKEGNTGYCNSCLSPVEIKEENFIEVS